MSTELDIDEIRIALRDYFADNPGIDEIRSNHDGSAASEAMSRAGFDPSGWITIAGQLGVAGIGVPESLGGLGLGMSYLTAALEECGASLYPGPARAAALTGWALKWAESDRIPEEFAEIIDGFLEGTAIVGVPVSAPAEPVVDFADGVATGRIAAVTHGLVADLVLCEVNTRDGAAIVLVKVSENALRHSVQTLDLSAPCAEVVLEQAPALCLTRPGDAESISSVRAAEQALIAAEQVGGMQGCLSRMVEYAAVRRQFDQVIGSYQAIQHRCSQIAVATVAGRGLVAAAAEAHDDTRSASASALGLLARAEVGEGFNTAADALIQVSGGIGFTWEHDAHLFFRRARTYGTLGGTPDELRADAVSAGCVDQLTVHSS